MADVTSAFYSWSATAGNNLPAGGTAIGSSLDDNLRQVQATIVNGLSHKGADIASAGTTDLGAVEGLMHDITGTTTITSFGTVREGLTKVIKFEGALTLTHNATSLILPGGANITTANGDIAIVISEGSGNWRVITYQKASGVATVVTPVSAVGTPQATTSGAFIDFTGIPSGTKQIIINFAGVSTSGVSVPVVRIGDSGGVETSGYTANATNLGAATMETAQSDGSGFPLATAHLAARTLSGQVKLVLESSAGFTWTSSHTLCTGGEAAMFIGAGSKSLSAELDRVRITTVGGSDTFDAGEINIFYI